MYHRRSNSANVISANGDLHQYTILDRAPLTENKTDNNYVFSQGHSRTPEIN